MTQDETEIMLFEEYIDTLIDRRIFHNQNPESDTTFEDRAVAAAKISLMNFLKELSNE